MLQLTQGQRVRLAATTKEIHTALASPNFGDPVYQATFRELLAKLLEQFAPVLIQILINSLMKDDSTPPAK